MEITKTDFGKLIDGTKNFCIPVYQRRYSWTKTNCQKIFYDVEKIAKRKKETGTFKTHFIGSIVSTSYQANPECPQYTIIDGQQRITSLMLLVKAFYDITEDATLRKRIIKRFLINEDFEEQQKYKLIPIENDRVIFNKIIDGNFEEISEKERKSLIFKNYELFKQMVLNSNFSVNELYQSVSYLIIGNIVLEDENPQQIFESLNSTGKNLTNADLIRNYLLMPTDYEKQVSLFNNYWKKIESCLEVTNKNDISSNLEVFLVCYLCMKKKSDALIYEGKRSHINAKTLYYAYTEYLEEHPNLSKDDFLKELKRYAEIFASFVKKNTSNRISILIYQMMVELNMLSVSIVIMYIYNQYITNVIDLDQYEYMLSDLSSYIFRLKVRNQSLNYQDFSLILQRYDRRNEISKEDFRYNLTIALCQNAGNIIFPSDEVFKNDVASCQFYSMFRGTQGRIVLSYFENFLSNETVDVDDASIEHICPQTLNDEWIDYLKTNGELEKIKSELHKIGNLTLTKNNSHLSNSSFEKKKETYKNSNFTITRNLGDETDWFSSTIRKRGEWFGEIATKIWKLPPDYSDVITQDASNLYELTDNKDVFNNTKPQQLIVDPDVVLTGSSWASVYVKFLKYVLENYGDEFKSVLQDNYWSNSPNSGTIRKEIKLDEDFYVEGNMSSSSIIKVILQIADYYSFDEPIMVRLK
ncbi:MAG: DUF262 domain-containing protein [Succinivibrionaceae bacterium]|nr:DUF262 domain-containing protein [Succinivibrionaceae bacterium]